MTGIKRAGATLVGAAVAGLLLWLAAQISRHTTGGYWAAYGVVAAAGLVLALSQLRGRDGHPPGMLLLGFLPVLVAAGWVLVAMEPHANTFRSHVLTWSGNIGIKGVVHDVATWLGVLAFGIGYTLGATLEPAAARRRAARGETDQRRRTPVPAAPAPGAFQRQRAGDPAAAGRREVDAPAAPAPGAFRRRTADEPATAERREVEADQQAAAADGDRGQARAPR